MEKLTRTTFEARLRELGYGPAQTFTYDECTHERRDWVVYFLSDAYAPREARPVTYGELGWKRYEGCEACCEKLGHGLFCGGLYEYALMFAGEARTREASLGDPELMPASHVHRNDDDDGEESYDD